MAEYNIQDIEIEDEDNTPVSKLLTGEVIKGLDPNSPVMQNAELEQGEYIQFPDGTTQKVVGKDHEKGGVKMNIPNGTKVISNNLTLTKDQVKKLNKDFELEVTVKDTYASAVEKYTKKIGLQKLNQEQEEIFEELEKVLKKDSDPNTLSINRKFLADKIKNIEDKKGPKEEDRASFFNVVFDMQESTKPKVDKSETLENGGVHVYEDGGEEGFSGTFKISDGRHSYSSEEEYERNKQARSAAAFGKIKTEEDINRVLQNLYENFPDIILDQEVFGKNVKVENGKVVFNKNLNFSKKLQQVKNFQERANDRMNASADLVISNPDVFGKDAVESAKKFKETQTFDQSTARAFDSKLGNFTSGRYNIGLDILSPEEKTKLAKQGIYTVNQLKSADASSLDLSQETMKRVNKVLQIQEANPKADYRLDTYTVESDNLSVDTNDDAGINIQEIDKVIGNPIEDRVVLPAANDYPQLFFQPDQSALPPTPMEAHLKVDTRLERIDPIRIGVEQTLQELSDQRQFVADQLSQLPDSQRASVMANLLATSQESANKAITQANVVNAQNQSQAELFNINQSTQESLYNANNALSFEQRQLTAKAKTEEALRRYYDYNRKVNLNNFQNQQRLNLLNDLYPDFNVDPFGNSIQYSPDSPFALQDRSDLLWLSQNV